VTLAGLFVFIGSMGIIPYVIAKNNAKRSLQWREEALTGSQIQRGPFMNSGSKDVGIDPNWDPKEGYKGRR